MVKFILKITGHVLDENKFGGFDSHYFTTKYGKNIKTIFLQFYNNYNRT